MSNSEIQNEVTDRTNDVPETQVSETKNNESSIPCGIIVCTPCGITVSTNDDPVEEVCDDNVIPVAENERPTYEVVFFVRYNKNARPSLEEITTFFNLYGCVHHINCPEGRNYAFIFMTSLNTTAEHRRTRTIIGQIISDMSPESRFHITVASSNREKNRYPPDQSYGYQRGYQPYHHHQQRNYGPHYGRNYYNPAGDYQEPHYDNRGQQDQIMSAPRGQRMHQGNQMRSSSPYTRTNNNNNQFQRRSSNMHNQMHNNDGNNYRQPMIPNRTFSRNTNSGPRRQVESRYVPKTGSSN